MPRDHERCDVIVLGVGRVARTFLRMLNARTGSGLRRLDVIAVADRSGISIPSGPLDAEELRRIADGKTHGLKLRELMNHVEPLNAATVVRYVKGRHRVLVIDASSNEEAWPIYRACLDAGASVVTANKAPVCDAIVQGGVRGAADAEGGVGIRASATVGAGLPVLDWITDMRRTGLECQVVSGLLSGTIGFVLDQVNQGASLSEATEQAVSLGYAEPDPALDLVGLDVERKVRILASAAGLRDSASKLKRTPLIDQSWIGLSLPELLARLHHVDFRDLLAERHAERSTLQYVAKVDREGASVRLISATPADTFADVHGRTNAVEVQFEHLTDSVEFRGPGAGIDVTAAALCRDAMLASRHGRFHFVASALGD